ncbi:MAG: DUF190 domain-containing protein [Chromatiales bacterium]
MSASLRCLHDEGTVREVTVFRGVTGFGKSGKMHSASLIDMSLDLPVVVEFFDDPEKVRSILTRLNTMVEPDHIVSWSAQITD